MSCRDLHWGPCWHGDLKLESQQGKSGTKSVIQGHKLLVTAWGSFPRKTALKQKLLTYNHRRTPKLCVKGFICVSFNVVCVYAYMYVCIVWVHAYVYICVCNECVYVCMWMNMSVCIWVCMHAYVCIHVWCICVCICTHIHEIAQTCTYTHVWRPEIDREYFSSILLLRKTLPVNLKLMNLHRLAGQSPSGYLLLPFFLPSLQVWG